MPTPAPSAPTPASPVDTKASPRRALTLSSLDDLAREIDSVQRAAHDGRAHTTGNWTPGQMMWHVAEFWKASFEGFGFKAPLPLRLAIAPFKGAMLAKPKLPAGLKLRGPMQRFAPPPSCTLEQGAAALRAQIDRVHRGERMTHPSPLFGAIDHDRWLTMHLAHAAHHLSFIRLD